MAALSTAPTIAALLRDALAGAGSPVMQQTQQEFDIDTVPWIEHAVSTGQHVGALQTDLPTGLLVAVVGAMAQGIDTWLVTQDFDATRHAELVPALVGLLRRALEP